MYVDVLDNNFIEIFIFFSKGENNIPINTTVEELVKIIEELARIH
jgi:hypothetical protein